LLVSLAILSLVTLQELSNKYGNGEKNMPLLLAPPPK